MTEFSNNFNIALTDINQSKKKNRPPTSPFYQQNLPAWQLVFTITTVISTIFFIGILFIPIGVLLLITSKSINEEKIFYDNETQINFTLQKNFDGDVYFYYGLENFFQNHRSYLKSKSDHQLMGNLESVTDCEHYDYSENKKIIAPCGAIANSMFTDSFLLKYKNSSIPWTYSELLWDVDKKVKFKNPPLLPNSTLCDVFKNTVKPKNWTKDFCKLDTVNDLNNGFENADFIIWMRTSALPNFKKPYRKLNRQHAQFKNGLLSGNYVLEIENKYQVKYFNGKKSFIISTMSWAGGKNLFMGIAYVTVGSFCIIFSIFFLAMHKKFNYK